MNEFTISEHLSCLGISLSKKKGGGGGVKADYHDLSQTLHKWGLWSLKSVSTQSPIEKKKDPMYWASLSKGESRSTKEESWLNDSIHHFLTI